MIQKEELRIGNHLNIINGINEIVVITEIKSKYLSYQTDSRIGEAVFQCFEPIKLTEEWFISCQSNSIFNNGFDYKKTTTGRFEVYIGVYLVTVIEFVHELQNLNFALLGEDVVFSDNIL